MTGAPIGLLCFLAIIGNVLAAVLSAGEAAVLRISRASLQELIQRRPRQAARLTAFGADPQRTASAAALLRVVCETFAAVCLTVAIAALADTWWLVLLIAALGSVLVAVVLVRLSPRTAGRNRPSATLGWASGALALAVALTKVIPWALTAKPIVREDSEGEELVEYVDRAGESGMIEAEEQQMIRSVFELSRTLTREVMVPRTDMIVIEADETLRRALRLFLRSGFSRIPVVGESTDDLQGVLYFKDVVRVIDSADSVTGRSGDNRLVHEVMRPAMFVPESKPVDALLREFQAAASHVALVVDEYGGIAGLVTIEDALEEIVGEVTDEHDTASPEIEELPDGCYRLPARYPVDELGELFGIELDDDDVDTVAGLLAKAIGKVPIPGSRGCVAGIELVAERTEGRRKRLATVLAKKQHETLSNEPEDSQAASSASAQEGVA